MAVNWNGERYTQALRQSIADGLNAAGVTLQTAFQRAVSRSYGGGGGLGSGRGGALPSPPGAAPGRQRGDLLRSMQVFRATYPNASATAASLVTFAGTRQRYASALERGFTATAKGGALLVPLSAEAHRLAERGGVRGNPDIFPLKRAGRPTLLVRKGPNGSIVPLFSLQRSVTVRARPWMRPTIDATKVAITQSFINAARRSNARIAGAA